MKYDKLFSTTNMKGMAGYDNSRQNIDPLVVSRHEALGINFFINGVLTGIMGMLRVPFSCSIREVSLFCDQSGSIKIDIWKDSYGNYPPTDADSICGGNEPEIVGGVKYSDAVLTDWDLHINNGDVLFFNVDSVTDIEKCLVVLKVLRNG